MPLSFHFSSVLISKTVNDRKIKENHNGEKKYNRDRIAVRASNEKTEIKNINKEIHNKINLTTN